MYICNSLVALKVAHITDFCNHACRILGDRQRLKTCQYYGFLQPTGLELGFGEIHTLTVDFFPHLVVPSTAYVYSGVGTFPLSDDARE